MDVTLRTLVDTFMLWVTTKGIKLIVGIVVLLVGWKVIKRVVKAMDIALRKRNVDITLLSFLDGFANVALKILLVVVVMGYVGIETTGIAAMVASAGLAIGLALQGSLSNFAGGVIILVIRPFNVGDYIETGEYSGTVERIGIFHTYLVTPDNKQILIPNGSLANGSVINYSTKALRRVDINFVVNYGEDINKVKAMLASIVGRHELIIDEPQPFVGVSAYKEGAIEFVVRAWCKNSDYWTIYHDLLEKVKIRFDEEGIKIPYLRIYVSEQNNNLK